MQLLLQSADLCLELIRKFSDAQSAAQKALYFGAKVSLAHETAKKWDQEDIDPILFPSSSSQLLKAQASF